MNSVIWINRKINTEFFKNTTILMLGTTGALLLSFVFQVFVRRYYSAEVFGIFDVYLQIFNILSVIAALRYDQAVVLPSSKKDSTSVFIVAFLSATVFSILSFFVIVLFKNQLAGLFNINQKYSGWLLFVPLSVFLFSTYNALNYWFIANKSFKVSSINKVVRRFLEGGFQTYLGFLGKSMGLILGDIFGNLINVLFGLFQAKRIGLFSNLPPNFTYVKNIAIRYSNFPKQGLLPNFLNTLCNSLPIFFVSALFDNHTTGQFGFARMLILIPQAIIAASVGQVIMQRFSQRRFDKQFMLSEFKTIGFILFGLSLVGALTLVPFVTKLIPAIFGSQWQVASSLFRIMLLGFVFQFTVSPLSTILVVVERLDLQGKWQIGYFLAIISLLFLKSKYSISTFTWILTIISVISYLFYYILIIYAINHNSINSQNEK